MAFEAHRSQRSGAAEAQIARWRFACVLLATAMLFICMFALAACDGGAQSSSSSQTQPRTFTDSLGRTVELPDEVTRVAVTTASSQEVVLTLAPELLVGLAEDLNETQAAYFGAELSELAVYGQLVGDSSMYNKDLLAGASPQLIVDVGRRTDTVSTEMDKLQQQTGVPCVHIDADLGSFGKAYDTLGTLLGKQERARALSNYCNSLYSTLTATLGRIPQGDRPKAAYMLGKDASSTLPEQCPQAAAFDAAVQNVMKLDWTDLASSGAPVSFEQLALWDPELIIFESSRAYTRLPKQDSWKGLSAIEDKAYYAVPSTPYSWLSAPEGPSQLLGLMWMAHLCYPDAFDITLQANVATYFKTFYGHQLTNAEYAKMMEHSLPGDFDEQEKGQANSE